ncbi:MAG: acyl-CoA thioesterase [Phycisphaerales bacterium]
MSPPSPSTPPPTPTHLHPDRRLALRVVTLPRDTNQYGTIFGGVILSYIDQAGFVEARRHGVHRWVTVALDRVEFKKPVHLGDVVCFYARTVRAGTSSVTVHVEVEAERFLTGQVVPVTEASLTLVSVDAGGKPIPFASPASISDAVRAPGTGSTP